MRVVKGAFTAMITPFLENGEIDWPGVARLIAWHESNGMDGVVLAGTNGEGPSLTAVEKRDLVRFGVEHAGEMKVILGAGTCSLPEAIWLTSQAEKAGAFASLVLPPFYFAATDEGIAAWFSGLLSESSLPCIIYNFPQTTGITLQPNLIERLFSQFEHCVGVKDSSGSRELLNGYLSAAAGERSVLVGNETLILESMRRGGAGTISGLANSFPRLISRQVKEQTEVLQALIDDVAANVKRHPQPAVHKSILKARGLPAGSVRPPLVPLSNDAEAEATGFASEFGF